MHTTRIAVLPPRDAPPSWDRASAVALCARHAQKRVEEGCTAAVAIYAMTADAALTDEAERLVARFSDRSRIVVRFPSQKHAGSFEDARVLAASRKQGVLVAAWGLAHDDRVHCRAAAFSRASDPFDYADETRSRPQRISHLWGLIRLGVLAAFGPYGTDFDAEADEAVAIADSVLLATAEGLARDVEVGEVWGLRETRRFVKAVADAVANDAVDELPAAIQRSGIAPELVEQAAADVLDEGGAYAHFLSRTARETPAMPLLKFMSIAISSRAIGLWGAGLLASADEEPDFGGSV